MQLRILTQRRITTTSFLAKYACHTARRAGNMVTMKIKLTMTRIAMKIAKERITGIGLIRFARKDSAVVSDVSSMALHARR
jgi:hypothetical protein